MDKLKFSRLVVDKGSLTGNGLDLGEFLFTLAYLSGYVMEDLQEELLTKGLARFELGKVVPSKLSIAKVRRVITPQTAPEMSKEELLGLANRLKAMFPKGIMVDGIPWTEGPILIVQRLEGFFRRFGNYPAEDIEKAMQRYVDQKKGTPFMRSLKNAIYKETEGADGTLEIQSDLYNYLENQDTLLNPMEDWTVELRE